MRRRELIGGGVALLASSAAAAQAPMVAVSDYERASGGRIGVYARNLKTGRTLAWRADERFVMCSTFKASLAACVLSRVDAGREDLARPIRYGAADMQDWYAPVAEANLVKGALTVGEMCAAAVEESDNTCANLLLSRIGGPAALTAYWRGLGDRVSRLDDPEPVLNRTPLGGVRDTTTPAAMAAMLGRLALGPVLSVASRRLFTGWLLGCRTGDDRLRAGLPAGWAIGDKTGNNGRDAAGDIAVVWPLAGGPLVAAVYTRGGSPTGEQLRAVFAGVGRFVGAGLG